MKKVFKAIGDFFRIKPKVVLHGEKGHGETHGSQSMKDSIVGDMDGRKHESKPESDVDVLEIEPEEIHEINPNESATVDEKFEGHPSKEAPEEDIPQSPYREDELTKDAAEESTDETHDFAQGAATSKEKTYPFEDMTDKQKWMYDYMRDNKERWIAPSEVGREFGKTKGKSNWGSQHSSKTLTAMVKQSILLKSSGKKYRFHSEL